MFEAALLSSRGVNTKNTALSAKLKTIACKVIERLDSPAGLGLKQQPCRLGRGILMCSSLCLSMPLSLAHPLGRHWTLHASPASARNPIIDNLYRPMHSCVYTYTTNGKKMNNGSIGMKNDSRLSINFTGPIWSGSKD